MHATEHRSLLTRPTTFRQPDGRTGKHPTKPLISHSINWPSMPITTRCLRLVCSAAARHLAWPRQIRRSCKFVILFDETETRSDGAPFTTEHEMGGYEALDLRFPCWLIGKIHNTVAKSTIKHEMGWYEALEKRGDAFCLQEWLLLPLTFIT